MNTMKRCLRYRACVWIIAVSALAAGCGRDAIFGSDGAVLAPMVIATTPANLATSVRTTNTVINATFNMAVAPISGKATMIVSCASPCANATGTVTLDATDKIATFTVTPGTVLATSTQYTVTITGATSLTSGVAMRAPYVWTFTTAASTDATRPRISSTLPATSTPGPTPAVPGNFPVEAVFTKAMAPATIDAANFTLTCAAPCVSPTGTVTYDATTQTAIFTPAAALTTGATYTATVTTGATDLAGNALAGNQAPLPGASNYVWTFTAAAPAAPAPLSVSSTNPTSGASAVCPNATVNATFKVPSGSRIDPRTLTPTTFTVTGPGPSFAPVTASSIALDPATGLIATFTPQNPLTAGVTYTATVVGGANGIKDLVLPPNELPGNVAWSFTVVASSPACPAPIVLGAAAPFGTFGGSAGMTNSGVLTVINGDIGTTAVSTSVTGFHDTSPKCVYTEVPGSDVGAVNGLIYTAPPPPTVGCPNEGTALTSATAMQARAAALTAYNALVAKPSGPDPGAGNLAGLTLAPGDYTAAAGSFLIQGGDVTLDAQGNANAQWVFQMATTLTVGGPGATAPQSVILANGAQAKNVFWQVGTAATINAAGGGTFVGTIISKAGAAVSTAGNVNIVTINGRVLSLNASVTLVDTVINVPAP